MQNNLPQITWFSDIETGNPERYGKESMARAQLTQAGFLYPLGFLITTSAYFAFLNENNLAVRIQQLLSTIAIGRPDSLMQGSLHIKKLIEDADFSDSFFALLTEYLEPFTSDGVSITAYTTGPQSAKLVSLTATDGEELTRCIKKAYLRLFSPHELWRRHHLQQPLVQTGLEMIVEARMPDARTGTVVTIDPATHHKDKIVLTTDYTKDTYTLSKKTLTILERTLSHASKEQKLTHPEITVIAKTAKEIESFLYFPQEISWILAADTVFIKKIRPISSLPQERVEKERKIPLVRGMSVTATVARGIVHIIDKPAELKKTQAHDILVLPAITKNQLPYLKKVSGIIVESEHIPVDSTAFLKHHGIAAIKNVPGALRHFRNMTHVTMYAKSGEVYRGGQ